MGSPPWGVSTPLPWGCLMGAPLPSGVSYVYVYVYGYVDKGIKG